MSASELFQLFTQQAHFFNTSINFFREPQLSFNR
ncbi:hypothetical protein D020_0618A, partial [Vibrio parahaemolyticus SBR10290]